MLRAAPIWAACINFLHKIQKEITERWSLFLIAFARYAFLEDNAMYEKWSGELGFGDDVFKRAGTDCTGALTIY